MALYGLRLRRAAPLYSAVSSHLLQHPPPLISLTQSPQATPSPFTQPSRLFRSSPIAPSSRPRSFDPQTDEIGPNTILFEGCDYEHWLITIDFPKDTQITREEMIETYVQTAAKVFGSVEEAKKRIYALSTTTYRGFQVLCSEETSKKFEGLPGVVFVLPDSYIDPVNKEYGGDKYINGEIIERPPPPQFHRPPRPNNRIRRGPQYQQNNYGPPQQNYGPPQGPQSHQNYGAPQGPPPQQNYSAPQGPPTQQNYGAPQGPPTQQNYGAPQVPPPQQNFVPPRYAPPQQNYGSQHPQPHQQNYIPRQTPNPPQNYGWPQNPPSQQSYSTPQNVQSQWNQGPQQSYGPQRAGDRSSQTGWDNSQDDRPGSRPPYQGQQGDYFPQREPRGYPPPEQRSYRGDNQNYAPPQGGNYGQGPIGGQVQGTATFGQNNPGQGEAQSSPQMGQRVNMQGRD